MSSKTPKATRITIEAIDCADELYEQGLIDNQSDAESIIMRRMERLVNTPTPSACVVTEGEVEKALNQAWMCNRRFSVSTAKKNITGLLTRAGGRVVTRGMLIEAIRSYFGNQMRGEFNAVTTVKVARHLADAILTAIAGKGE